MTTLPSVSFTAVAAVPPVVPLAHAVATSRPANGSASHRGMRMGPPPYAMSLDAEMVSELGLPGPHVVVAERGDDRAVAEQIVAVGHRRRKAQVLLHEQNGPPLPLRLPQDGRDLLDQDRREPLGRLVEEQEPRAHPEDPGDREHLLLPA